MKNYEGVTTAREQQCLRGHELPIAPLMPLHLYSDVMASGHVPEGWTPLKSGTIKYPVRNPQVQRYLKQLLPGRWQKVIKKGNVGEIHYFEHASGQVAGVKYFP